MNMKRLAIILSLVSLLIGSVVTPAYSFTDKCLTTKKFKEVDHRTFMRMTKDLVKYANQAFVLRGYIDEFKSEKTFSAYWYGKGETDWTSGYFLNAEDISKNQKRTSKLIEGDYIKAKVILRGEGSMYPFLVCSATIVNY